MKTRRNSKKKQQEIQEIRDSAIAAFNAQMQSQANQNWMLQEIAKSQPGLVYYVNPTSIGQKLKKAAVDVNKILEGMGFQYKLNKTWHLTTEGERYGALRPFNIQPEGSAYPISGNQVLWSIDVIPLMKRWLKSTATQPKTELMSQDNEELMQQLSNLVDLNSAFVANIRVEASLEEAQSMAMRYFSLLAKDWFLVTSYARPRKQGSTIYIKVSQPKDQAVAA